MRTMQLFWFAVSSVCVWLFTSAQYLRVKRTGYKNTLIQIIGYYGKVKEFSFGGFSSIHILHLIKLLNISFADILVWKQYSKQRLLLQSISLLQFIRHKHTSSWVQRHFCCATTLWWFFYGILTAKRYEIKTEIALVYLYWIERAVFILQQATNGAVVSLESIKGTLQVN